MTRAGLALAACALAALCLPAAAGARAPKGFYGTMWDGPVASADAAEQDRQFALMRGSRVETLRVVFSWARVQPTILPPDYEETDRLVALGARHGVRLLPVVIEAPDWAKQDGFRDNSPPRDPEEYATFVRSLVQRYGPRGSFWATRPDLPRLPVREWQIWNEMHLDGYWNDHGQVSTHGWTRAYTALLKASHRAIKTEDPGARVVLGSLADYAWRHLARLYSSGARRYFDVATINMYTSRPDLVLKGVRLFRKAMKRGRDARKPAWLTEVGWPASLNRNPRPKARWQRAWETTDAGMARRVRRFFALALRARRKLGLARVYWYTWSSSYRPGSIFNFTGLTRFDGQQYEAKPALAAFRASARRNGAR